MLHAIFFVFTKVVIAVQDWCAMGSSDDEKDGADGKCTSNGQKLKAANGKKFVDDVLNAENERCVENFRMDKHVFYKLCDILQAKGLLRHTNRIKIEEQLAIFMFIIGHNLRTRAVQDLFKYSGETISRHFNNVLNAIIAISLDFFKPPGSEIPPEIRNDPRFFPYFMVILLILLLTKSHSDIGEFLLINFITCNVLGLCGSC